MKPQVVVVGSFVQDLTFFCEQFPLAGQTIVGTFKTGPGGKGSNQAIAAGRTGVPTCFIGAVGRDAFSEGASAFYKTEKIAARFIEKPGHATATAGILVNQAGQNEIVVALGASAKIQPRDIDSALIRAARVVVCQHEATLAINAHIFRVARKAGVTTVLNPAPMRKDFDSSILKLTDILIPNETEFVALARSLPGTRALLRKKPYDAKGLFDEAQLAALSPDDLQTLARTLGVPTVIITLGKKGCFVSQADTYAHLPACTGLKVVDTTGAGDAFCGGFAAGLVKFNEITAAAKFGTLVAGLSVTKPGTAPSMPTAKEIARFRAQNK